jgi:pimeloyl-ACP methyl ester carboxylesterase
MRNRLNRVQDVRRSVRGHGQASPVSGGRPDRAPAPRSGRAQLSALAADEIRLHGHRVRFHLAGEGPVVVLLHGIASTADTWAPVVDALAVHHTVLAPDLLGHGASAKPRGDYSLGAYACGVRDLVTALGVERATVVGHSLGGGIAMQFAYQFPERVERLVLIASGGLGREVHPILRAATLPGSELVLALLGGGWVRAAGGAVGAAMARVGLRTGEDLAGVATGIASLGEAGARSAFVHTARAALDAGGQRVSATDRLYLAAALPTLIVWGERDPIIPVAHGRAAHDAIPGSRLEVFAGAGHFPHREDPLRFVSALEDFLRSTRPATIAESRWRDLLRAAS